MKHLLIAALLTILTSPALLADNPPELSPPQIEGITMDSSAGNVTFTVLASGDELEYQWLWQGLEIPGGTNSVLFFADAYASANAGYYSVRVSNPVVPEGVYSSPHALLFTKPTPAGSYQGLFYPEEGLVTEATGFIQFRISSSKQAFSGKLFLGKTAHPFSGLFSPSHEAVVQVPRAGGSPLEVQLQLLTLNDTPRFTGWVSDGNWLSLIEGRRLYFSSKNPTGLAGKYTLALQNTNSARSLPNGSGYAALVVRRDGKVVVRGQLPDGTAFSQTSGLARGGQWALYAAPYQGRGRVLGWLQIAEQPTSSISGANLQWFRGPAEELSYPDGFSVSLDGAGSVYVPPVATPVLGFTNGVASFYAGDLFSEETATWQFSKVMLRPPATFRPHETGERTQLKVNKKTGVLSGSFVNLISGARAPVRGVVLQKQNLAQGFFLSSGASGAFTLVRGTSTP